MQKTWLACQGYSYEENSGALSNAEVNRRQTLVRGSGECTFYGKVAVHFFEVTKTFSVVLRFELRTAFRGAIDDFF